MLWLDNGGVYLDASMQERCNSVANALEWRLSCTKPSIYTIQDDFTGDGTIIELSQCQLSSPVVYGWINHTNLPISYYNHTDIKKIEYMLGIFFLLAEVLLWIAVLFTPIWF